jgi:hypothetical protein
LVRQRNQHELVTAQYKKILLVEYSAIFDNLELHEPEIHLYFFIFIDSSRGRKYSCLSVQLTSELYNLLKKMQMKWLYCVLPSLSKT